MKKALFAGTFDPPTLGHLDLIQRAAAVCDKLYVGIAINTSKTDPLFTVSEREAMLKTICRKIPHIEVVGFSTLVTEFAKEQKIDFLVRGLRAFADLEYEVRMALTNRQLSSIDTLFLLADEKYGHISSTLIREMGKFKGRLHDFVPKEIEEQVFQKISKNSKEIS
jgi:pantetheine-phosphate adenylyltransferase